MFRVLMLLAVSYRLLAVGYAIVDGGGWLLAVEVGLSGIFVFVFGRLPSCTAAKNPRPA